MGMVQSAYTLSQAIKRHGKDFRVYRNKRNEFREPIGEEPVGFFRGLFHISAGYLDITVTEAAKISTRKQPMLLLLHTDKMEAIRRKVVQVFSEKGQRRFSLSLC